jgi:hypothetical protein
LLKVIFLFLNIVFNFHSFVYIHRHNKFQLFLQKTFENSNFIFISFNKYKLFATTNFSFNFSKIDKTFLKVYLGNIVFFNNNFYTAILPRNIFISKVCISFLKNGDYLFLYLTDNKYLNKKRVNFLLNSSELFYLKSFFFFFIFFI